MDYVQAKIFDEINFIQSRHPENIYSSLAQNYRMLFEYHLTLMFAALFNRKKFDFSRERYLELVRSFQKYSWGEALNFIFEADALGKKVFGVNAAYAQSLRNFIEIRNQVFGHGTILPDTGEKKFAEIYNALSENYAKIIYFTENFFGDQAEFRLRKSSAEVEQFMIFLPNGKIEYRDVEKNFAAQFNKDALYFACDAGVFEVSPFIIVQKRASRSYDFFRFTEYNPVTENFHYGLLVGAEDSAELNKTCRNFFNARFEETADTICHVNGVITNKFDKNFRDFAELSPHKDYCEWIWNFLTRDEKNVCCTICGAAGVGKTAVVQHVLHKKIFAPVIKTADFERVIYCSAKSREVKFDALNVRGRIKFLPPEKKVTSYAQIIDVVRRVLNLNSGVPTALVEATLLSRSGIIFILDSFDELAGAEQKLILSLIARMRPERHRVIITSRSQKFSERVFNFRQMDADEVFDFMDAKFNRLTESRAVFNAAEKFHKFADKVTVQKLHNFTAGLPLLAEWFTDLLVADGFSALTFNKKPDEEVAEFLALNDKIFANAEPVELSPQKVSAQNVSAQKTSVQKTSVQKVEPAPRKFENENVAKICAELEEIFAESCALLDNETSPAYIGEKIFPLRLKLNKILASSDFASVADSQQVRSVVGKIKSLQFQGQAIFDFSF